jgi:tRNA(fMet)-specific endonuclease VapC
MIIFDTNVLIEILKGNQQTLVRVSDLSATSSPLYISVITAMELIYGARNKQEAIQLERFLEQFRCVQLNSDISTCAFDLIRRYAKSHTLDIPDALIAASAITNRAELFTYNTKDFRFIPDLSLL